MIANKKKGGGTLNPPLRFLFRINALNCLQLNIYFSDSFTASKFQCFRIFGL